MSNDNFFSRFFIFNILYVLIDNNGVKYYNIFIKTERIPEGRKSDMSEELNMDMDIVSVVDDDGVEHLFEELDRIETDNGNRYVALIPIYDDEVEILDDDGDVLILKVMEEDGETYLVQIEDEKEFNEIGNIFEDRLIEKYEAESTIDE